MPTSTAPVRLLFSAALLSLCIAGVSASFPARAAALSEAEIRSLLKERIDVAKRGVGIVVGIVNDKGMQVVSYGKADPEAKIALNGDTLFEIGSITKVFTATLLQDMVNKGEVSLDDPVARYLPGVSVPGRNGEQIRLLHLATHRSGLPRMPSNFAPKDPRNPFVDYSPEQLYAFLGGYTLARDIGAQAEYSNLGMGLLGHALAKRAGMDYEALVKSRILQPLGMSSSDFTLDAALKARMATGHGANLQPTPNWDFTTLAGAGALRSTANDMLRFLAANLGLQPSPLQATLEKTHEALADMGRPGNKIALGWSIMAGPGAPLVWHNGGTGGFRTFAGMNKATREGVIVLSNAGFDVDDIGRHLLDAKYPLEKHEAPREMKQMALAPEKFDPYVGKYQLTPKMAIVISREGERFLAKAGEQPQFELKADSETHFFAGAGELQMIFVRDEKGAVSRLILRQGGRDMPAAKVE